MRLEETKIKASLKALMKRKGLLYRDLAERLGVSTATIKRRLNDGELNLSQLAELAECVEVSLYELIELSRAEEARPFHFSRKQEELLANDLTRLLILRLIMIQRSFEEIRRELKLSEPAFRKKLRELEEVGLIRRLAGDRLVSLVQPPVRWIKGGPLQKAYFARNIEGLFRHVQEKFTCAEHDAKKGALCKPFELYLSERHARELAQELSETCAKYVSVSRLDMKSDAPGGRVMSGLIVMDAFSLWSAADAKPVALPFASA